MLICRAVVTLGVILNSPRVSAEPPDAWIKRWQQAPAHSATPEGSRPPRQPAPPAKPIPRAIKIAAAAGAALSGIIVLALSLRAWRAANVFGQQYRFRVTKEADLRLGAPRCGGHMATMSFGAEPPRKLS